jgi:SMC interacting uncharacterized protein involved in chromosome segregation
MPITSELDNRRKFKAAGFTDEQSEVLVEVIERSVQQGFEKFAEVLERSLSELRGEMNNRFSSLEERMERMRADVRVEIGELRGEIGEIRVELRGEIGELRGEIGEIRVELRSEIGGIRGEIGGIRGEIGSLRGEFQTALRDQLFKLVALIVSVVGLGVAIIKLFPNWY